MTNPSVARLLVLSVLALGLTHALLASSAWADTQPPSQPKSLTASADGTRVTLVWGRALDDVAVTGFIVQRCQGAGCTGFASIATLGPVQSYVDTAVAANATFRYRVAAVDAAGNVGQFSKIASATTGSGGGSPPPPPPPSGGVAAVSPRVAVVTFSQKQQFTSTLRNAIWSVDGIAGGSPTVGQITRGGLYTPPRQVGAHTIMATARGASAKAQVHVSNTAGVFTHHNDNARTGQLLTETVLTPVNVGSGGFGKLFSYALDGQVHAAPLYVANVKIPGRGLRNVVYAATQHNSVYALDADRPAQLWHASFINPAAGVTTVPADEAQGQNVDIEPEIGITGTPVIDPATGTLYVVAKTKEVSGGTTRYVQKLHALDIATGAEKFGGPAVINATVDGTGEGSVGGRLPFDSLRQLQRAALLLSQGVVYIAFGSHGDARPWHGWLFGYDARTLQRRMFFNTSPNAFGGGIWQGGGGPATDAAGNVYFATGNGTFSVNQGGFDWGDSYLKLNPNGEVLDFFTPHDESTLDQADQDLGSGAVVLVPNQGAGTVPLMVGAGKNGVIYVVNRNDMGHYQASSDNQIVQSLFFDVNYSAPVYWKNAIYFGPVEKSIKRYTIANGLLSTFPSHQSSTDYGFPGAGLAVSARGASNGILWAIERCSRVLQTAACPHDETDPGVLRAYDAGNLDVLYSSDEMPGRDGLNDLATKLSIPVVANGKVFVGSMSRLTIYGLLP